MHIIVRHPMERNRYRTPVIGVSLTHQSHKDLCDVNAIVKRFDRTGELPPATREPQYADVSSLQGDLTERISTSREILDTVGRHVDEKRKAFKKMKEDEQLDLVKEVERLRAFEASVKENREA